MNNNINNINNINNKSWFNNKVLFIISLVIMSFSSFISVFAVSSYLYNSNEVSFNNSSSNSINSSNVQGAIDELYADAHNYEEMNTRVAALEDRWRNGATGYFGGSSDDMLHIGYGNTTAGNRGITLYDQSNVKRARLYYNTGGVTVLESSNSSGGYGTGELRLDGNPVKVNGVEVTGPTKINLTASVGTMANNTSFSIGNATFVNIKVTGINIAANTSYTIATIPSANRPSAETSCMVWQSIGNSRYGGSCWIRANGEIAVGFSNALNNSEIRIISAYLK